MARYTIGMETNRTDQRKHVIQMSRFEADAITGYVQSIRGWMGFNHPHVSDRKQKWNVTDAEILDAIRNGEIVEVHQNHAPEVRAVVRADIGMRSICVAVSLTTRKIATVWVNTTNDQHGTLRLEEYKWNVNLMQLVAGLRTSQVLEAR